MSATQDNVDNPSASSTETTLLAIDDRDGGLGQCERGLEESISISKHAPTLLNGTNMTVVLDWDLNDPENPQTWSASKKMYHILVPTILGFVV
jgi:hypothetical protein